MTDLACTEVPYESFLQPVPGQGPSVDERGKFLSFTDLPQDLWTRSRDHLLPRLWKTIQSTLPSDQVVIRDTSDSEWYERVSDEAHRPHGILYGAISPNTSNHDLTSSGYHSDDPVKDIGMERRLWAATTS